LPWSPVVDRASIIVTLVAASCLSGSHVCFSKKEPDLRDHEIAAIELFEDIEDTHMPYCFVWLVLNTADIQALYTVVLPNVSKK
jgi:hypothetical protein